MDINELLSEALENIESMSIDEFEILCIESGYIPIRKQSDLVV